MAEDNQFDAPVSKEQKLPPGRKAADVLKATGTPLGRAMAESCLQAVEETQVRPLPDEEVRGLLYGDGPSEVADLALSEEERKHIALKLFKWRIGPFMERYLPEIAKNPDLASRDSFAAFLLAFVDAQPQLRTMQKPIDQLQKVFGHQEQRHLVRTDQRSAQDRVDEELRRLGVVVQDGEVTVRANDEETEEEDEEERSG